MLPRPPSTLIDREGVARFGAYAGPLGPVDFAALDSLRARNALWTALHHKRWVYVLIASPLHLIAAAIVDLGYAGTAFVSIVDRRTRAMLYDHSAFTAPNFVHVSRRAEQGCDASFRGPGARLALTRPIDSQRYNLAVDTTRASVHATLDTHNAPVPIVALSPVSGGAVNVTTKRVLLPARGALSVDGESHEFNEAIAGMDYTNGLLARETSWRWAMGMGKSEDGRPVAFNLVAGFNDERECVAWVDGEIAPISGVEFDFDPQRPLGNWGIHSSDERISVTFRGDTKHEEQTRLGIVRSSFVQPMGVFSGRLSIPNQTEARIVDVPGVVENQETTW